MYGMYPHYQMYRPEPCPEGHVYVSLCDDYYTGWGYQTWNGCDHVGPGNDLIAIPAEQHERWERVTEDYRAIQDEMMEAGHLPPAEWVAKYQAQP
jgi:hypothetical protein